MPSKRDARNYGAPSSELAYLGLHQAALHGNVGLVKYALQQGQPVDAVRDGISALHAAAAGGSEHVARLLVDSGADITFGRLPRTEREMKARTASSSSNPAMEKTNDPMSRSPREPKPRSLSSSSSISTPDSLLALGSTPLHFACAYNNPAVARVLLAAGAAPHIRDKAGNTPLDLLPPLDGRERAKGEELRLAIREFYEAAKAREKEERDGIGRGVFASKAAAVLGFPAAEPEDGGGGLRPAPRKSTENMRASRSPKHVPPPLASHPHTHAHAHTHTPPPSPRRPTPTPPSSPSRFTFGSATMTPPPSFAAASTPPLPSPPPLLEHRRPSLPHLFAPTPPSPPTPSPPPPPPPPPPSARRPLYGSSSHHRPRSAGSGSGSSSAPAFGSTAPRPPRTKRSLLSLFKRGDCEEEERERERERRDLDGEWARERERLVGGALPPPLPPPSGAHTAPPGRTTFDEERAGAGGEEEEEEYGVLLTRTPDVLPPAELPDSSDEESRYSGADVYYEDDAEREEEGEGEGEDEDAFTDEEEDDDGDTAEGPHGRRFIPPAHAEAWYRDRVDSAPRFQSTLADSPTATPRTPPLPTHTARHPSSSTIIDAATPSPRPGILRTERGVRQTASRGALRFDARVRGDSVSSGSTNTNTTTTDAPRSPGGAQGDALLLMTDEGAGAGGDEGLSVRTVSSHAQAEALVQKAAKEILERAPAPALSLSAQLAAYGETLQLERRFARGEAQRWKSPVKERFGGEAEEAEEEEERRRRERMVRSQREMDRYASAREKERDVPGKGGKDASEGARLERTASLEKALEPRRRPRPPKTRRPHTSESAASGNVPPPRFGHSTTYSSSSLLRGPVDDSLRGFARERRAHHHASRSASAHPRAESFDHERARAPPTPDEDDSGSLRTGSLRSAFPLPALALDEFGASMSSIRPPPATKRFGGLRSLFGKARQ